jgi:hypothetical protein
MGEPLDNKSKTPKQKLADKLTILLPIVFDAV